MARPLRLEFPRAIYHLTGRGNARQKVFFTDADRELFLNTLTGVVSRYYWICHAYCLMANHYHLLVETPKTNLSIGMRQLNGIYTQSFNRRHNRVGHLFQGRFKAILVERESHLLELCRYIVLNPARVKGSAKASTWKWSSYRATAGFASVPEFLRTDWILEQFGKTRLRAQQQYREFVKDIKEIPRAQLRAAKPSLKKIFGGRGEKAIGEAYAQGYRLNEIAVHLGVHYATVSRRLKRIEQAN